MASFEREYYEFERFWDPALTPLGSADHERVESIFRMLPDGVKRIADIGCGNGLFCNFVSSVNPRIAIIGLDRSMTALKYVQTPRVAADITRLPFADRSFDCVTSLEVLEHLPIPTFEAARIELARIADNALVVSVPNAQTLGEGMTRCPECRTAFDPDLHLRSFNRERLSSLFSDVGFRCVRIEELGLATSYRGLRKYLAIRGKLLRSNHSQMSSPLCPICGFRNDSWLDHAQVAPPTPAVPLPSWLSAIKRPLKRWWPTEDRAQWIAALYVRA
jgi:SAM-dependent methyltransferase